jgi:GDP-mannose 6-dehydrogenase
VEIIEILLGRGFDLCVYDKNIQLAKLTGKNKEYIESRIPHLERLLSNDLEALLHSADVIVVSNKEKEFISCLENVENKIIIDMVKLPDNIVKQNMCTGINW